MRPGYKTIISTPSFRSPFLFSLFFFFNEPFHFKLISAQRIEVDTDFISLKKNKKKNLSRRFLLNTTRLQSPRIGRRSSFLQFLTEEDRVPQHYSHRGVDVRVITVLGARLNAVWWCRRTRSFPIWVPTRVSVSTSVLRFISRWTAEGATSRPSQSFATNVAP